MRTLVLSGVESAVATAAELVLDAVASSVEPVVALPTGRTMVPLYDEIALRFAAGDRALAGARGFNLDELLVPAAHPASFASYMRRHAYGRTGLDAALCDIPRSTSDPAAECARYDAAIKAAGGFDLAILGVGADGHVAYNLPGAPVGRTHVVELAESLAARLEVAPEDRPLRAITVGLAPLLRARRVIVLATGAEKSAAVRRLVDGPIDEQWPCSLFCDHPAIDVVLTLESASDAAS